MASDQIDWEAIERDFRAGLLSLREIGSAQGVSEGAIRKRAKRDGWERDLGAKIHARAEAMVRKAEVRLEERAKAVATEREIIEANASRIAQVRGEHRSDINRLRAYALSLVGELEAHEKKDTFGSRLNYTQTLANTLKTLVTLEREAYGLDNLPEQSPDAAKTMDRLELARRAAFLLVSVATPRRI